MVAEFELMDSYSRAQAPNCYAAPPSHAPSFIWILWLNEYVWSRADVYIFVNIVMKVGYKIKR